MEQRPQGLSLRGEAVGMATAEELVITPVLPPGSPSAPCVLMPCADGKTHRLPSSLAHRRDRCECRGQGRLRSQEAVKARSRFRGRELMRDCMEHLRFSKTEVLLRCALGSGECAVCCEQTCHPEQRGAGAVVSGSPPILLTGRAIT